MTSPCRIVVLISGGGSNLQAIIDAAKRGAIPGRICAVISNEGDAFGLTRAKNAGVHAEVVDHRGFQDRESFDRELIARIRAFEPDLVVLAGFMRILTRVVVEPLADRLLNIHPSLLPKYPGLDTHARALAAGDPEAGCTVHQVTAELDAGPILGQGRVPVLPGDTPDALAARVLEMEHRLYPAVLRRFALGDPRPVLLP